MDCSISVTSSVSSAPPRSEGTEGILSGGRPFFSAGVFGLCRGSKDWLDVVSPTSDGINCRGVCTVCFFPTLVERESESPDPAVKSACLAGARLLLLAEFGVSESDDPLADLPTITI